MDQAADRYTPVMAQWGIPDPRQASGYPDPDTAPMAQWAWEFLRRSDDYREQWSETIAPLLKEDGEFDEDLWARIKQSVGLSGSCPGGAHPHHQRSVRSAGAQLRPCLDVGEL